MPTMPKIPRLSMKPNMQRRAIDWRAIGGEFIATALFVWAGCGTAVASQKWGSEGFTAAELIAISLGFGLTITTLAYGFGHISGGHMNPAVTFSFIWLKSMDAVTGLLYMLAQFAGAWFGALVLWGCTASLVYYCDTRTKMITSAVCEASMTPDGLYGPPFGLGANQLWPKVTNACGFLIESVGTYVLVITVLHVAVHEKSTASNAAPIAIGWAVLIAHLVLVPMTGCGINPARSFGPLAVDSMGGLNKWSRGWWVFFTAPFVGSWFATLTYQLIFQNKKADEGTKEHDMTQFILQNEKSDEWTKEQDMTQFIFQNNRADESTKEQADEWTKEQPDEGTKEQPDESTKEQPDEGTKEQDTTQFIFQNKKGDEWTKEQADEGTKEQDITVEEVFEEEP